jgi:poly(3-hydroxybutyrate) depolymerase
MRWAAVLLVLALGSPGAARSAGPDGSGVLRVVPAANPPLVVFFHRPATAGADARVVIAMHGLLRQGAAVRDAWREAAEQQGFVVAVPQFDATSYRGTVNYNTGRVLVDGKVTAPATWSFAVIEEVFDALRAQLGLSARRYVLYGHSAGAQFVHRYALLVPGTRADRFIAANAGWYTLPLAQPYPWGLEATPIDDAALCRAFARPLTLLLGELDNDPEHEQLNRSPQAMAQGATRLARGEHFFQVAQQRAAALGCPLRWQAERVPQVGHEFDKMAGVAARLLAAAPPR